MGARMDHLAQSNLAAERPQSIGGHRGCRFHGRDDLRVATTGFRLCLFSEVVRRRERRHRETESRLRPARHDAVGLNLEDPRRGPGLATGGLDDTVIGWAKGKRNANGFKFNDADPEALLKVLANAADLFDDRERWNKLTANAFALDHSWETAAGKYERLYRKILRRKKETAKQASPPAPVVLPSAQT